MRVYRSFTPTPRISHREGGPRGKPRDSVTNSTSFGELREEVLFVFQTDHSGARDLQPPPLRRLPHNEALTPTCLPHSLCEGRPLGLCSADLPAAQVRVGSSKSLGWRVSGRADSVGTFLGPLSGSALKVYRELSFLERESILIAS